MKKIAFIVLGLVNTAVCAATEFRVNAIGDFSPWAWSSSNQIAGVTYSENGPSSIVVYEAGNLTNLGNPTDATSIVPQAINASGQIVVNAYTTQGTKSYLIDGMAWTPIQIPRQSSYSPYLLVGATNARGLTNDGTVYGWYDATNSSGTASAGFIYRNGGFRDLYDEVPVQHSRVVGITSDDTILINTHKAGGGDYSVIAEGSQGSYVFTNPHNEKYGEIKAVALSGAGGFAGNLSTPYGERVFRVDVDGTFQELTAPILPTPTGFIANSTRMYLTDYPLATRPMNSSGTITGTIENTVFVFHAMQGPDGTLLTAGSGSLLIDGRAFVERQGTIEVLPLPFDMNDPTANLSFNDVRAAGINDLGTVWGTISHTDYFYEIAQSGDIDQPVYSLNVTSSSVNTSFVYLNHESFDINALLDQATGVSHYSINVIDVDDHNNVLVQAWEDGNTVSPRAYVLTLVPEPKTYALMLAGSGLVGLIAHRRKRKFAWGARLVS